MKTDIKLIKTSPVFNHYHILFIEFDWRSIPKIKKG